MSQKIPRFEPGYVTAAGATAASLTVLYDPGGAAITTVCTVPAEGYCGQTAALDAIADVLTTATGVAWAGLVFNSTHIARFVWAGGKLCNFTWSGTAYRNWLGWSGNAVNQASAYVAAGVIQRAYWATCGLVRADHTYDAQTAIAWHASAAQRAACSIRPRSRWSLRFRFDCRAAHTDLQDFWTFFKNEALGYAHDGRGNMVAWYEDVDDSTYHSLTLDPKHTEQEAEKPYDTRDWYETDTLWTES